MRRTLLGCIALGLAWGGAPTTARAAPVAAAAPIAAAAPVAAAAEPPIERVVVYSDQARVFRNAHVVVGASPARALIATLPPAARPDTVRVECGSAEITDVEVSRTWERLPRQAEGKALLAKIEQVRDEIRALDDEHRLLRTELGFVEALQPVAQRPKPDKTPPLLFVDSWRRVLQWAEGRASKVRARLAVLPGQRYQLEQQLEALRVAGRELLPDAASGPALHVAVTLRGRPGTHRVALSYVVGGVRWVPSYDLHYDPQHPAVEASYYALVSQSSGEDWKGARLAFSTIMPSNLLAVPELPTWTLGRTTGFTPTPRLRWEPRPSAWRAPEPTPPTDATMDALEAAVGRGPTATGNAETAYHSRLRELEKREADAKQQVYRARARVQVDKEVAAATPAAAPPPPPAPEAAADAVRVLQDAPAPRSSRRSFSFGGAIRSSAPPTETVPWTDTGYRPPTLDPDLPAASAQGYRFTMDAPGRHTVAATGSAVRVPLGRERFTVNPVYKIVPGRSLNAYLTAEVFNSTGRPVLRGHANLFTGVTYSGQTKLETAVPGAKLLLPLGVDEGVKVNRTIDQRTVSSGVFFKDDVSEYTVTIEIANHRRHGIQVDVEDQVPVTVNKDAKVEGFAASPAMRGPQLDGKVTYQGIVGAGRVQKLTFKFRIVRPKNWELRQHDG